MFRLVAKDLVADDAFPAKGGFTVGDVVGPLTSMHEVPGAAMPWTVEILLATGPKRQHINMPLEPFIFQDEIDVSQDNPLSFIDLRAVSEALSSQLLVMKPGRWLWLFRNGLYLTERPVREADLNQVLLAIKARHYRSDEQLKRLKAEVANFEALDQVSRGSQARHALRDDVKLLVWSRDGGRCVACHSAHNLHFDHVSPVARGGSDESENIQLLCRTCNLAKSDRIV